MDSFFPVVLLEVQANRQTAAPQIKFKIGSAWIPILKSFWSESVRILDPTQVPIQVAIKVPTQVPTQVSIKVPIQVPIKAPIYLPIQLPIGSCLLKTIVRVLCWDHFFQAFVFECFA